MRFSIINAQRRYLWNKIEKIVYNDAKNNVIVGFHSLTLEEVHIDQICGEIRKNVKFNTLTIVQMLQKVKKMLVDQNVLESRCTLGLAMVLNNYSEETSSIILQLVMHHGFQILNMGMAL